MTTTTVIEKVRKLLALASNNANVNEAAAAAARAQELLFEHKLSMAEVEAAGQAVDDQVGSLDIDTTGYRWQASLLTVLCRSMYCRAVSAPYYEGEKLKYRVVIFGKQSDTQTVSYLNQYLQNEINRLAALEGRGLGAAWANSFRAGAVVEISIRLKAQQAAQASAVTENALVLIKRDSAAVDALVKKTIGRTVQSKGATVSRPSGFNAGRAAGATISLGGGRGIGAAPKSLPGAA